ncbi:MAG: hypothetical protein ACJLS2_00675 [Microcella pacifica]
MPKAMWRAMETIAAHRVVDDDADGGMQQRGDRLPAAVVEQQVVALHDDGRQLRTQSHGVGHRLFALSVEAGGEHGSS